jgi:hypothetical protein
MFISQLERRSDVAALIFESTPLTMSATRRRLLERPRYALACQVGRPQISNTPLQSYQIDANTLSSIDSKSVPQYEEEHRHFEVLVIRTHARE